MNVPPQVVEHLNIEKGDTIALQAEYSEEHGEYASFWNESEQEADNE